MAGITWRPRFASHHIGLLHIRSNIARRETIFHGQRIEEGFDGRSHLTAPIHHHIVGKMHEVKTADIRLHMSVLRTHAHESGT